MRKNGYFKNFLIFLLSVLFFHGVSNGQVIYIDITGTVTDDQGSTLPGVNVELFNTATGYKRTLTTDVQGKYLFKSAPSQGKYQIKLELTGFKTEIQKDLEFSMNMTYTINFVLKIGGLQETVDVVAKAPLVDVKGKTIQQTFSDDLIKSLPLNLSRGRSYLDVAAFTASTTGINPGEGKFAMSGQSYKSTNIVVDGSSNYSKWLSAAIGSGSFYSIDMIKEVQILSHSYSVEFGEGMAAVSSAITRSGTNEFSGSLTFLVQPGGWTSPDLLTGKKSTTNQQLYGFSLGGPIIKDKTHFFLAFEGRGRQSHNIVIAPEYYGQAVPDNRTEYVGMIKIDHQLSDKDYLSGRFNFNSMDQKTESGGYNLPGNGIAYIQRVYLYNLSWTRNVSSESVNEMRFQFLNQADHEYKGLTQYTDRAAENRAGWSIIGGSYGGGYYGTVPENTYELFEKYSWQKEKHFFKVGGFVKFIDSNLPMLFNPRGIYYFKGSPSAYPDPYLFTQNVALDPSLAAVHSYDISGQMFFEDEWSITKKLTLTLGALYYIERPFGLKHFTSGVDWNNFAPRLGFAYSLGEKGTSVLRGGIGIFYQQLMSYDYTQCDFYGKDGIVTVNLTPDSPFFPTYPNYLTGFPAGAQIPPRDIWQMGPTYNNPYSVQATIGYKGELFPTFSLGVDLVYMTVYDGMSVLDINAPPFTTVPRTTAEADALRPITPVPNGYRKIEQFGNLARAWYRGMEITLERRASDFSFILSYTLSKATDYGDRVIPYDSTNIKRDDAPANNDQLHKLRIAFFYKPNFKNIILKDVMLSGVIFAESALPYTQRYGDDRFGTTQNDARPYGRNNLRGDPYYSCNLSLSKSLNLRKFSLEFKIDIFNPFNIKNYTSFEGRLIAANFGQPLATAPARQIQLAIIFRF